MFEEPELLQYEMFFQTNIFDKIVAVCIGRRTYFMKIYTYHVRLYAHEKCSDKNVFMKK